MLEVIKEKLVSRKFWALIGSLVASVMVYKGADQSSIDSIVSMVGMFGTAITYILVQGKIDKANVSTPAEPVQEVIEEPKAE